MWHRNDTEPRAILAMPSFQALLMASGKRTPILCFQSWGEDTPPYVDWEVGAQDWPGPSAPSLGGHNSM